MDTNNTNRREFFKKAVKSTLPLLAFNFGCDISKILKETDRRGVILYGTKYGSTEETSFWISEGIKKEVDVLNIEKVDFKMVRSAYDVYVLGSGVWIDGVHKDLKRFLESESSFIDGKVIATFVVCGSRGETEASKARIKGYLNQINNHLEHIPLMSQNFGGRLIVKQLTHEDHEALVKFYRTYLHKELEGWNYMDKGKTVSFGKEIDQFIATKSMKIAY